MKPSLRSFWVIFLVIILSNAALQADALRIGLNYSKTGPYAVQGLAQLRGAKMAVDEINAKGGILGRKVELRIRNTGSEPDVGMENVKELIDIEDCEMIFGGSSSAVVIASGKVAKSRDKIYFGTLTYSNETTGVDGHKYMFRECYNAWMGARVLARYLNRHFSGKKYFYITADYTWGWTTEDSVRKVSNTEDRKRHKSTLTPFPGATISDFRKALVLADAMRPDVLVLVLFGKDMANALKQVDSLGLNKKMEIVVPNLVLGMAESAGEKAMEGVVGALSWCWKVPYVYNYEAGKKFVEKFAERYESYPSSCAASAYTILLQYKEAVEKAETFDSKKVIEVLEGHKFALLKDEQCWRSFDHQCVQTVYAVKCKPARDVLKDKFKQDYFEIIDSMAGNEAARTKEEWVEMRKAAGNTAELEW